MIQALSIFTAGRFVAGSFFGDQIVSPVTATMKTTPTIPNIVPAISSEQAKQAIRSDVSRNVDVNVLAKQAGLSRAHFFRLFESSIGVPPRVYLNVMRLEHAVAAVMDDNDNVAAIGSRLGFDVPAHFTRFFRNHTGVSPREFRAVSRLAR